MKTENTFKKIVRSIYKVNILGSPPEFHVAGKSTAPSWIGTILSFVFIILITILGFTFARNALDTENPEIKLESTESPIYPKIELFRHKFFLSVLPNIPQTSPYRIDQILTVKGHIYSKKSTQAEESGAAASGQQETSILPLLTKKCSEVVDSHVDYLRQHQYFTPAMLGKALCLVPPEGKGHEYLAKGQGLGSDESFLEIHVLPCVNNDPSQCAPASFVNGISFYLIRPVFTLDYSKTKNFLKVGPEVVYEPYLDTNIQKILTVNLMNVELLKIDSIFSEERKEGEFIDIRSKIAVGKGRFVPQTQCLSSQLATSSGCHPYVTMTFKASGRTKKIIRTYGSLIQAMSETGGFGELLMILILGLFLL